MSLADTFRIGVPAIVVPAAVFGGNWAYRQHNGYPQTAAGDFILALLIFDGGVIATSEAFEPFINNPDLRSVVIGWHMTIAAISACAWVFILKLAEPKLAAYYEERTRGFPVFTCAICWMVVFVLIVVRILFFVVHGGGA